MSAAEAAAKEIAKSEFKDYKLVFEYKVCNHKSAFVVALWCAEASNLHFMLDRWIQPSGGATLSKLAVSS